MVKRGEFGLRSVGALESVIRVGGVVGDMTEVGVSVGVGVGMGASRVPKFVSSEWEAIT